MIVPSASAIGITQGRALKSLGVGKRYAHPFRRFFLVFLLTTLGPYQLRAQSPSQPSELARSMREAVATAQSGDERSALNLVSAVIRKHPGYAPALKLQGMLLEDLDRGQEASESYQKALKSSPNDPELLLKVAIAELVSGHPSDASVLLQRRRGLSPHDEEGLYYLAQAFHLEGKDDSALATIREAARLFPDSASVTQKYGELLCSTGDNEGAMRQLLKAQQLEPKLERLDFDLAVASYNSMDWQSAILHATRHAAAHPGDMTNLTLLASSEVKLGQWSDAERILKEITAVKIDDAASMLQLGHCELELTNYSAAIADLKQALQLDPTQVLAHFLLSRAYSSSGNTVEAEHEAALHREMMRHISYTRSKSEAAHDAELAAQARGFLKQKKEEAALKLFEASSATASTTRGTPWVSLASVYLSIGDSEDAQRCLNHALELDARTRDAHTYLGIIALQQADLNRAEANFKAELALDPNHALAEGELGEIRYRQGRWAEAADHLVRSKTTVPSLLYMLCDSYFHLGKPQNANLIAESLMAYGRSEPEVLQALGNLLVRNGQTELANRLLRGQKS
jgi:tetratricopeptide (TPR) repeat protein